MNGKIKTLGLIAIAMVAISATAVSAASAASSLDVGSSGGTATITGQIETGQEHVFAVERTDGGVIVLTRCTVANLEAAAPQGNVTELTATPTYSGCKLAGLAATVRLNGCRYTLTSTATALTWLTDIVGCTSGKKITIASAVCTLEIGDQNGLSHLIFKNEANNHATLEATISGITVTQKGAACVDGNNHTGNLTSFLGNTTLTGFTDAGTETVTEHEHQFSKNRAGSVLTLTAT